MNAGQSDSRVYPIVEREKVLRTEAKLLRKLCRHLKDEKWFVN